MAEQAVAAQNMPSPPSKDPQNTSPLPSQDDGYGITLDSMIVIPRVPTLVEGSTDVGTEGELDTPEVTPQGFTANSSMSENATFMKQFAVTLIYVVDAIEKESQAHVETKKLAEKRLKKNKSFGVSAKGGENHQHSTSTKSEQGQ